MCCKKCSNFFIYVLLPFSILAIFLLQIYAQYSTLVTLRRKSDGIKDGRNTMTNYKLTEDKQYDFSLKKIQEYFDDNALMKIQFLKNQILKQFDSMSKKKEGEIDIRTFMLYYLIIYDIICIIIVYCFVYGSIKAGLIKIILQIIRFYYNVERMQKFNTHMSVYSIIKGKFENILLYRKWKLLSPEVFLIIELFCNCVIILDIIYIIILIRNKRKYKKKKLIEEVIEEDPNIEDNKDEKNETDNGNEEEKIISKINHSDEESDEKGNDITNEKDTKSKDSGNLETLHILTNDEEEEEEDGTISDEADNNEETAK